MGVAILISLFMSTQVNAQGDLGNGGIGGRPAFPRGDNSRSESIFIHTIINGESVQDGIQVINNTADERTILVYPTDSVGSSGGAFACAQFVDEKVDVGAWITTEQSEITLAPGTSEVIKFSISVPITADAGEHNGCMVVEEAVDPTGTSQGIGLNFRTAVRTAIFVPGDLSRADLAKQLEIIEFSAQVNAADVVLSPKIENTGVVSVDTNIETRLKTVFGTTLSTIGGEFPVLRTQTGEWNFAHGKPIWGGWYKASVTATYDENPDNFIGEGESSTVEITHPDISIFILPSGIGFLIELGLLLVCGFFLLVAWKRKKKRDEIKRTWVNHTLKKSASIKAIAKARGVHWKKIAKINKLKAPYHLEVGQKILIPPKKDK